MKQDAHLIFANATTHRRHHLDARRAEGVPLCRRRGRERRQRRVGGQVVGGRALLVWCGLRRRFMDRCGWRLQVVWHRGGGKKTVLRAAHRVVNLGHRQRGEDRRGYGYGISLLVEQYEQEPARQHAQDQRTRGRVRAAR